jgi:hypothetical protein
MNRRTTVFGTALLGLAAGATGLALTGAQAQAPAASLTYVATPSSFKSIDAKPKGPSVGDQVLEGGKLVAADGGNAGHYALAAQLVAGSPRSGSEQTGMTLFLSGGQLSLAGGHGTVDRFAVPVVGGTGSYAGARGVAQFAPAAHGRVKITVALQ